MSMPPGHAADSLPSPPPPPLALTAGAAHRVLDVPHAGVHAQRLGDDALELRTAQQWRWKQQWRRSVHASRLTLPQQF